MANKKILILATDKVADDCMAEAMSWHIGHPTFSKESTESIAITLGIVSEYLANKKGFTMYRDIADYPKELKDVK